jgi:UDP-hydrolysing UDP-N-acetyl-D-glucosamine 2-epimerase
MEFFNRKGYKLNKRTVCVVITARPSYSRIKAALKAINEHQDLELKIILAGSSLLEKYGRVDKVIKNDGFTVTEKIYNTIEGETVANMAKTTGVAIMELSTVFYNLKPSMVITIADRFETIATSIAASYQNIPLVHIQGGEVTGNIDEKVRHANTKFADIHLVASENARKRVIRMGESPKTVINTGCPSMDLAKKIANSKVLNFDPFVKYGGVGKDINWKSGYIVVMQHPVTTEYKESEAQINETMEAVKLLNMPTFWFWPNVDSGSDGISKGIRLHRESNDLNNIHFYKNMDPNDFLNLVMQSKCLVGNSSAGIRECSFLGVPVVNIGTRQHMRQRGRNVMDCDYKRHDILGAVKSQLKNGHYAPEFIYGDGTAGEKISEVLANIELKSHKTITY